MWPSDVVKDSLEGTKTGAQGLEKGAACPPVRPSVGPPIQPASYAWDTQAVNTGQIFIFLTQAGRFTGS